jgi:hypothetical protein
MGGLKRKQLSRGLKEKEKVLQRNWLRQVLVFIVVVMEVLLRVCSNISSSFLFHQISKKHNKLLEQQLKFAHLEVNLNMKGKKLALVAQACDLLTRNEQLLLCGTFETSWNMRRMILKQTLEACKQIVSVSCSRKSTLILYIH